MSNIYSPQARSAGGAGKVALLQARYGHDDVDVAGPTNAVIELILSHRSVRRFRKEVVDDALVRTIVSAAQSAPTGLNLQNWSIVHVTDAQRIQRLSVLADDQPWISNASIILFFVVDWERARNIASWNDAPTDGAAYFDSTISAVTDASLAAQNAALAARSLGFGTCYLGAIRNNLVEVSDELGLPKHTFPIFGLIIGRPDPDDRAGIKPRLAQDVVLHRERYSPVASASIQAFEERITKYYNAQGNPHSWIATLLRRICGSASLDGRARNHEILKDRGLATR